MAAARRAVPWWLTWVAACSPRPLVAIPDDGTSGGSTGAPAPAPTTEGTDDDGDDTSGAPSDETTSSESTGAPPPSCLVPVTHATIQDGIDDADCPTVWVAEGTYDEHLRITRAMTIEATDGAVTIDGGGGGGGSVVEIDGAAVVLRGLTITGGRATTGGGIATDGALELHASAVIGNEALGGAARGGGIHTTGPTLVLTGGTRVDANLAAADDAAGGGIWADGTAISIADATISDNLVSGGAQAHGGGLYGAGEATIELGPGTVFAGNTATAEGGVDSAWAAGGGVYSTGTLRLDRAQILDNEVTVSVGADGIDGATGGGIAAMAGTVSITDSLIAGNTAQVGATAVNGIARGGGIHVFAETPGGRPFELVRSSVTGNRIGGIWTAYGGGIALELFIDGDMEVWVVDSTISANAAEGASTSWGSGLYLNAIVDDASPRHVRLAIASSTFADNARSAGSNLFTLAHIEHPPQVVVTNSIFTGDDDGPCGGLVGDLVSGGHNLFGGAPGCGQSGAAPTDRLGVDPLLGPLGDNGGPTPTHAPSQFSPAIDGGAPEGCRDPAGRVIAIDQRGLPRVVGAACDIGAVER